MEEGIKGKEVKPLIKVDIELEVRDKNGKLIESRRQESHSYVRGLIGLLRGMSRASYGSYISDETIKDIAGTDRAFWAGTVWAPTPWGGFHALSASSGDATYGLVIGTGTTPVSMLDVALGSKIAHGSGSGQMNYGSTTVDPAEITSTVAKFNHIRTFSNVSGSAITVNEVGLYVQMRAADGNAYNVCIARDIISGGVSVPNGSTLTVRYIPTISTT